MRRGRASPETAADSRGSPTRWMSPTGPAPAPHMCALPASGHLLRQGNRTDPADHPAPTRTASRSRASGWRGGARHPQPFPSHRRRSEGRRPARYQADVRHQSAALIETARRLRDDGTLPTGRKVGGRAGVLPRRPRCADRSARRLAGKRLLKVESGAQFGQTQFCMDAGIVRSYVGRLEQAASPDSSGSSSASIRALSQVGGLDEATVRHHHSRRVIKRMEKRRNRNAKASASAGN